MTQTKLLFFVSEDWYFLSHRLPLALAAKGEGYRVSLVTNVAAHGRTIESHGIELIPLKLDRRSKNPLREMRVIWQLVGIYRRLRPDIVHQVALKPVLYGTIAAYISRVPIVINALAGLGYIYSSQQRLAAVLRPTIKLALKWLINCRNCRLIVQNPDDREHLVQQGIVAEERIVTIRGSGVDPQRFNPSDEPEGPVVVTLPARMLWDKGVAEFVEAARNLRLQGVHASFLLAGDVDPCNPASVPVATLEAWNEEGAVEWIGPQSDMPALYRRSHIICLPSYREGLPKSLLEAAASARPIVTTDVPGCREIAIQGENGLLVPARDSIALANAIVQLIGNTELRRRMGQNGRRIVLASFTIDQVVDSTLALYRQALSR